MGLIKKVLTWSVDDQLDYLSVNQTRDEVSHYKVSPEDESEASIVRLSTMKDFSNITCLDFSREIPGMVGIGEKEGYVKIIDVLAAENKLVVHTKHRRCVNTIGINGSGIVAMGLDKHKQDASLQIWDVNYQKQGQELVNSTFEYCVNESIVSLSFLNDVSLLASSTKFLKEIDLRVKTPVYQHPTRLSYDIKLNPFNIWQFCTYGDDGTLGIWDRRMLHNALVSSDIVHTNPLLTFDKLVGTGAASRKYMNTCFRWSPVQNGEFATLHRGNIIKRWRLGSCPIGKPGSDEQLEELFVSTVDDVQTTFDRVATFDYIPKSRHRTSIICMRLSGTVYRMPLTRSYTTSTFNHKNSLLLSSCDSAELDELRVDVRELRSQLHSVSTRFRNLTFEDLGLGEDYPDASRRSDSSTEKVGENKDDSDNTDIDEGNGREDSSSVGNLPGSSANARSGPRADSDEDSANILEEGDDDTVYWKPERLLETDISVIMRMRAKLGYGLDPMKTVDLIERSKILENNRHIRNTWRWIAIAKGAVDDGTMVLSDLDLGYQGVLGIWNGLSGIADQNRFKEDAVLTDKQLIRKMEEIIQLKKKYKGNRAHRINSRRFFDSPKSIQRKLCLMISGWDLSESDYEEKYKMIIAAGHYEKAAAWAVFVGDVPKAVEILGSAKKERLRLIATAIAGYMVYKDEPRNNSWRQQCRKMSSELDDPYLRVIFAFVADNDWWDILYEPAISLRERLGVALRFLNDADLTKFLERTASSVIANGELEGLILTGITPSGIDLLQSYVNKTSDVQTAALISIYGSPRYFKDRRVDEWLQAYRRMLNSWEMFSMRAKIDVLRTKLSRTSSGTVTAVARPRQLYIQCINCKRNINSLSHSPDTHNDSSSQSELTSPFLGNTAPKRPALSKRFRTSGNFLEVQRRYSCPHCGMPYPRCAICLMPVGMANLPFVINGAQGRGIEDNFGTFGADVTSTPSLTRRELRLHEWFSFCLSCNHGMHAGHAEEWFSKHNICPTPGCNCNCSRM